MRQFEEIDIILLAELLKSKKKPTYLTGEVVDCRQKAESIIGQCKGMTIQQIIGLVNTIL